MTESPAARRHRIARAVRSASTLDAAADLLQELDALVDLTPSPAPADALDVVDVPWELAEMESLPDWTMTTLVQFVLDRRPAPSCVLNGETRTMRAQDLLASRKYELIGLLARAAEQAWDLGDAHAVKAMAELAELACVQVIGQAGLQAALGGDDEPGDAQ